MKITAFVHFSVPYRMAGSETMLHTMLCALADAGHDVTCVTSDMPQAPAVWNWGPVKGISAHGLAEGEQAVLRTRPDVIISHHQNTQASIRLAKGIGAKSVFIQHNDFPDNSHYFLEGPDMVVFNTHWIAKKWGQHARRWAVVHPPVWAHEHATTPGDSVTMVNLNKDKGALLFYQLARRFPTVRFLGVLGSHGDQMLPRHHGLPIPPGLGVTEYQNVPPNVVFAPQTTNMKADVWPQTKVLLVPSVYESYGMVAPEALASGIPVIATPTPGLKESLGIAGIFARRNEIAGWVYHLKRLLTSEWCWAEASKRALSRSATLDPEPELKKFVQLVEGMFA